MKFTVKNSMVKYNGVFYREGETLEAPSMPEGLEAFLTAAPKPEKPEQQQPQKQDKK